MVDEDRCEPVANSLVHQLCRNSGIHTTADSSQNPTGGSNELPYPTNLLLYEVAHGPLLRNTANVDGEILEQLCAVGRVGDLWVELDAIDRLVVVGNGGELRVLSRGNGVEAFRQLGQLVTVRHPDLHAALDALKQAVGVGVDALGSELC